MLPKKLKSLIEKYCMAMTPTDEQLDEIMDLACILNADSAEVSKYIKKMVSGPTKEEREAKAEQKRKAAEERKVKESERKAQEEVKRQDLVNKVMESSRLPYVDLGLSVMWATSNVGASNPEDIGNYYAWGTTEPKQISWFDEPDKVSENVYRIINKGKAILKPKYDAATQNMPRIESQEENSEAENNSLFGKITSFLRPQKPKIKPQKTQTEIWRIPTEEEWIELEKKCTWKWTHINDVYGFVITGRNGNCMFLPAAGWISACLNAEGEYASYWSSTCYTHDTQCAVSFDMDASMELILEDDHTTNTKREYGLPVRAVKK